MAPALMQIALIPEERRDPKCPIKWTVTASQQLIDGLAKSQPVAKPQKPTERYNAAEAEARWQKVWDERGIFATPNEHSKPKYYVLEMFPYP